ncbi:hypothetical protein [Sphingomonas hankyongi]|uniref:Uncharacterized protein n=1 Tax=Sphingomonas hankyongi TaxID=2908209 RepID=A0ABT0S080_9SPHN|nr:hypothetical protein [Sphingomonas hankyongi]MCL6729058.1 hypothetical protein [Sphingomonas hankyongi]
MSKLSKPTVELKPAERPSRIRRDPVPQVEQKSVRAYPTEREIFFTVIGVVLFALAVVIITFGVSDFTSH